MRFNSSFLPLKIESFNIMCELSRLSSMDLCANVEMILSFLKTFNLNSNTFIVKLENV